jgi:hypothetical protein
MPRDRDEQVDAQVIPPALAAKVRDAVVGAVVDGDIAPGEARLVLDVFSDGGFLDIG